MNPRAGHRYASAAAARAPPGLIPYAPVHAGPGFFEVNVIVAVRSGFPLGSKHINTEGPLCIPVDQTSVLDLAPW